MSDIIRLPGPVPAGPTNGQSCDGGDCDAVSVGWRWYDELAEWLPVCWQHITQSHPTLGALPPTWQTFNAAYSGAP
jgi:hypothetical protein